MTLTRDVVAEVPVHKIEDAPMQGDLGGHEAPEARIAREQLKEGTAAERLADKAPGPRVPPVEEVALLRDVVEFEQLPDPEGSHNVRDPRDVDKKTLEAPLEQHAASHHRRVGIEVDSRGAGKGRPQVVVDLEPIARAPHSQKSEVGLVAERSHGRDLELEQMVLGWVHVDGHDLLWLIVKQIEHASSAGGDAEHAFPGAEPQRFELTAGIFVAR